MDAAQDRKSPNMHIVPVEEAQAWKKFIPYQRLVDKDASIATIVEGKPLSFEVFDVNDEYSVIFKPGEDRGRLSDIEKNDIVVVKDGDREVQRLRYLEPESISGEVHLEFRVLGPEGADRRKPAEFSPIL